MVWCFNCAKNIRSPDCVDGKICCSLCGRVLDEDNFSNEPTFVKNAAGQSQLSGNVVRTMQSNYSLSRERALDYAYRGIQDLMYGLGIDGGDSIARPALAFYTIAFERNFTRGRRKEQVEAACLYITCRVNNKPYLLIDFSQHLGINVYVLGAVFLQLALLLSLQEHPIIQKPVDPSLFIGRFIERIFHGRKPGVYKTAIQILTSMKRDWLQTGRKPSGICGVALYAAALAHGLKCSKLDIIKHVHVSEATLRERLFELGNTESGAMTLEELNTRAQELEKEEKLIKSRCFESDDSHGRELLCEHKDSEKYFAHGLCESCFDDFMKLSGGLDGGSDPPAFQRAERERITAKEADCESIENELSILNGEGTMKHGSKDENLSFPESSAADKKKHNAGLTSEESEGLSDIDEDEVDSYLLKGEEQTFRKDAWEKMNKEYLEELAAKEAAALAVKKAHEANLQNCPEEAKKLAAAAAEAVAKSRKERQQKRAEELKNLPTPKTAAEATRQMLTRKRLSSKINYDVLDKLFDEPAIPKKLRKSRTEPASYEDKNSPQHSSGEPETENTKYTYENTQEQEEYGEEDYFFDDY